MQHNSTQSDDESGVLPTEVAPGAADARTPHLRKIRRARRQIDRAILILRPPRVNDKETGGAKGRSFSEAVHG